MGTGSSREDASRVNLCRNGEKGEYSIRVNLIHGLAQPPFNDFPECIVFTYPDTTGSKACEAFIADFKTVFTPVLRFDASALLRRFLMGELEDVKVRSVEEKKDPPADPGASDPANPGASDPDAGSSEAKKDDPGSGPAASPTPTATIAFLQGITSITVDERHVNDVLLNRLIFDLLSNLSKAEGKNEYEMDVTLSENEMTQLASGVTLPAKGVTLYLNGKQPTDWILTKRYTIDDAHRVVPSSSSTPDKKSWVDWKAVGGAGGLVASAAVLLKLRSEIKRTEQILARAVDELQRQNMDSAKSVLGVV